MTKVLWLYYIKSRGCYCSVPQGTTYSIMFTVMDMVSVAVAS